MKASAVIFWPSVTNPSLESAEEKFVGILFVCFGVFSLLVGFVLGVGFFWGGGGGICLWFCCWGFSWSYPACKALLCINYYVDITFISTMYCNYS